MLVRLTIRDENELAVIQDSCAMSTIGPCREQQTCPVLGSTHRGLAKTRLMNTFTRVRDYLQIPRFARDDGFHLPIVPDIVTRAPTRIDFGGGWTDVPPYSDEVGGFVCNLAIARYANVTVTRGSAPTQDDRRVRRRSLDRGRRAPSFSDDRRVGQRTERFSRRRRTRWLVGSRCRGRGGARGGARRNDESDRFRRAEPRDRNRRSRTFRADDRTTTRQHTAARSGFASPPESVDVRSIPLGSRTRTELERRCIDRLYGAESHLR